MFKSRRIFVVKPFAFLIAVLFIAVACGGESGGGAQRPAQPFTIATFPGESYILDVIAQKQGMFAKNGLAVKTLAPPSGAQAIQFIVGGSINGWSTNPTLPLPAVAKGESLVLAGMLSDWITFAIQMRKDESLPAVSAPFNEKMAALKGKTIGVSGIGAVTDIALVAALKLSGLSDKDVHVVAVGAAQAAAGQLQAKRLDGYVSFSNSDGALLAQQAGTSEYINFLRDSGVPSALRSLGTFSMVTSQSYYKAHGDLVRAWVKSLGEALAWLRQHPGDGAALLNQSSYGGQFEQACVSGVNEVIASSRADKTNFKVSRTDLQAVIDLMAQTGQITGPKPTYDQLVVADARA